MSGEDFGAAPGGIQALSAGAAAQAAGAALTVLDLSGVQSRSDLMDRLARDLKLPEYFGRNWDALYDVLSDADRMTPTALHLLGWEEFRADHPRLAAELQSTFEDAQDTLAGSGVPLWLLA